MRNTSFAAGAAAVLTFALGASGELISSFEPGGVPIAVGFGNDEVFVYAQFTNNVQVYDMDGNLQREFARPGANNDEFDLDYVDTAIPSLGGTFVPAGSLLAINGDDSPDTLYALDPLNGTVLASVELGDDRPVGGAYNPADGLFYALDFDNNLVRVFDPATGTQTDFFTTSPTGSSSFPIFFGDLDVDANGNIQVVSSSATFTRVLATDGTFVQDFDYPDVSPKSVSASGIAFDTSRGEAWVSSTNNNVFRFSSFPAIPEPTALAGLLAGGGLLALRRRR